MLETIEINYISPISDYEFNNPYCKYHLVAICSTQTGTVIIHKADIQKIDNVNNEIRAYSVNKSIQIFSQYQYPNYLFCLWSL